MSGAGTVVCSLDSGQVVSATLSGALGELVSAQILHQEVLLLRVSVGEFVNCFL